MGERLLRWLKDRGQVRPREAGPAVAGPGDARSSSHGKFLLEPLEPRVLLSADSILGEVYRSLLDDEAQGPGRDYAVIVEEIDAATSAEIAAADGEEFGGAASENSPKVTWPESWQAGAADDSADDSQAAADDASDSTLPAEVTASAAAAD